MMGGLIEQKNAEHLIKGEGQLEIGPFNLELLETPGHSPGSVSFYVKEKGYLFSGDVLFKGSVGRTDLPGGSMDTLMNSIRTKLLKLPGDTIVFPGHGEITLLEDERASNPFLNGY